MNFKSILIILCFFSFCNTIEAQQLPLPIFGEPTQEELEMSTYDKDSEASGVVLYEGGQNSFEFIDGSLKLIKEVYKKIKVVDAQKFGSFATITIPYYSYFRSPEKITSLIAITHNGEEKINVAKDDFYQTDVSEKWSVQKFTFPNIKNGSVLEYSYRLETSNYWNFKGWDFQDKLPKIYSEFKSSIPGNLTYNRSLYGSQKLAVNDLSVAKDCVDFDRSFLNAECEVSIYAVVDVPATKKEKYMLSEENYISRVEYELQKIINFQGDTKNFTKTWNDVDMEFKQEKDLGRQLKYANYFEKNIPATILDIKDKTARAKAIYYFIRNHFTWNGNYRIFNDIRVKESFEEKKGNIAEINLSLINALQAAGLDAKILLSATRDYKTPNSLYPVLTDFNYVMAYVTIEDEKYILDATDASMTFGLVPFRALNDKGRVMDFDRGSFWFNIEPNKRNLAHFTTQLTIKEDSSLEASVTENYLGYSEVEEKQKIKEKGIQDYAEKKEKEINGIEFSNFKMSNGDDQSKSLKIEYSSIIQPEFIDNQLYLNPYRFQNQFRENPLKANERQFPIDFGYPFDINYMANIIIDPSYMVEKLPENKKLSLPQDLGHCTVVYSQEEDNKISLRLSLSLQHHQFISGAYPLLQKFFESFIDIQNNDYIVLKKI